MGQLVSKTIPGFFNGVSQQSVTMRLDTQGEIQTNAMGTIVDGLYKRPPTQHVTVLDSVNPENAFQHMINRDLVERYMVFITADPTAPIEVHTINGVKCTVRYGHLDADLTFTEDTSVRDYLQTSEALPKAYKAVSIADYTIITNRSKIVAMTSATKAGTVTGAVQTFLDLPLPYEDVAAYDATRVYAKGDMVKWTDKKIYYRIFDGEMSAEWNDVYSYRAGDVVRGANSHLYKYIWTGAATTNVPVSNTTYWEDLGVYPIVGVNPTNDFFWRYEDDYCEVGDLYEISGDEGNTFDNYYVEYTGEVWQETLAPGEKYEIDSLTMPHRLVRTGVNQFTFAPCLWEDRTVGDEDSCPVPSFVGKSITNITFFKNRLGFLARDTFFLARAGRYFELFGETAIDLLDDDPIDMLASSTNVVDLVSSIPFDKNLLVNSEQGQFSFGSSGTTLTPKTASLTTTTMYATDKDSDPVGAGANVYFVNPRNRFVSVMEYLIQPDTLTEDAADITAHCPHFIPNGTIKMVSCIPMDMIVLFSTGAPNDLFIYKYYWVGNEKPQSAWSKWTVDGTILGIGLINTELYITIKRGSETVLEKVQLENMPTDPDLDFRVHLDRQVRILGTYNPETRKTRWTLPWAITDFSKVAVVNPATGFRVSRAAQVDATTVEVPGDHTANEYIFGVYYRMHYRLSEWYIKDQNKIAVIDSKLQIRTITLAYRNTGAFNLVITPENREPITHYFSGVRVGVSRIGEASLLTGEEKFLVMCKSKYTTIDIISDSYLPCQILSGSLEGMYVIRAERV